MSGDVAAEVAAVLAAHYWAGTHGVSTDEHPLGRYAQCACGWSEDYDLDPFGPWRAHVADALAPLIAERVRVAQAEALREFHARWFGVGWPGPEDIQEMHADLAAKIGGR